MHKALRKPEEIEFITFEEFDEYAKNYLDPTHWIVPFQGYYLNHESRDSYILPDGSVFTNTKVLIKEVTGLTVCSIKEFKERHHYFPGFISLGNKFVDFIAVPIHHLPIGGETYISKFLYKKLTDKVITEFFGRFFGGCDPVQDEVCEYGPCKHRAAVDHNEIIKYFRGIPDPIVKESDYVPGNRRASEWTLCNQGIKDINEDRSGYGCGVFSRGDIVKTLNNELVEIIRCCDSNTVYVAFSNNEVYLYSIRTLKPVVKSEDVKAFNLRINAVGDYTLVNMDLDDNKDRSKYNGIRVGDIVCNNARTKLYEVTCYGRDLGTQQTLMVKGKHDKDSYVFSADSFNIVIKKEDRGLIVWF